MKNLLIKLSRLIFALMVILSFSRCEEENTDKGAILLVIDEWIGEPVAGAEVTVYRTLDDWAYERNHIKKLSNNAKGEVLLEQ